MKPDEPINFIISEIKQELKEEKQIDLSEQEIFNIANSQFVGAAIGVNKRVSFDFRYIGTLVLKNMRSYIKSIKEINKLKDQVSEEEYNEIIRKKKIANKDVMNGSKLTLITNLSELPEDIASRYTNKHYSEIYKRIINEEIDNG